MASATASLDFAALLREQLSRVHRRFRENELAFLALTSKVELPIRDRLAYELFLRLPNLLVSREWRRVDLVVLSREANPAPRMLLEAKALYTFDLVGDDAWIQRYPEKVQRDLEKLRAIDGLPSAAQLFGLVLATHPRAPVGRELKQVAKYWPGISKAVREQGDPDAVEEGAKRSIESRLARLGPLHPGKMPAGKAYEIPLDIHYWLVGPIDHAAA